jgi:hypothetical protein
VPLLNADEVNELTTFYNNNKKLGSTNFHSTHFSKDRLFKRNVHEKIISVFEKPLKNILINYNLTFANFMVKELGENSVMPLHADWTYVDEAAFQSLGIWCPLTDTNEKNGMLGVVPCSHNFKPNKRGPKIPSPFHDFNQYIIDNYGKLLPVKAGEVVIYDHRTLHFSPPNLSNNTRIAINIVATPAEATLLHFANFGSLNEIECFQPKDSNFYVEYDHFEKPDQSENSVLLKQDVLLFTKGEVDAIFKQNTNKLFHFFLNFFNKLK